MFYHPPTHTHTHTLTQDPHLDQALADVAGTQGLVAAAGRGGQGGQETQKHCQRGRQQELRAGPHLQGYWDTAQGLLVHRHLKGGVEGER